MNGEAKPDAKIQPAILGCGEVVAREGRHHACPAKAGGIRGRDGGGWVAGKVRRGEAEERLMAQRFRETKASDRGSERAGLWDELGSAERGVPENKEGRRAGKGMRQGWELSPTEK